MSRSHFINHFQEIGWSDPNVLSTSKPKFNLVCSTFNQLAYDVSKYAPHSPPWMIYLPSLEVFRKMVETFMLGKDDEPVKSVDEVMAFYIEEMELNEPPRVE